MKKQVTVLALAAGLSTFSLPAFAEQDEANRQTVNKMTEEQMDEVTAGLFVKKLIVKFSNRHDKHFKLHDGKRYHKHHGKLDHHSVQRITHLSK